MEGQREPSAPFLDEACVLSGGRAPQSMIDVDDPEAQVEEWRCPAQKVEEHHGIDTAGDAGQDLFAPGHAAGAGQVLDEVIQNVIAVHRDII